MYIDAAQIGDRIWVSERTKQGERRVFDKRPPLVFYYTSPDGLYTSIHGDKLSRERFSSFREFRNKLRKRQELGSEIFESGVKPVYRLLEELYESDDAPDLHLSIIDIEADKDPKRGYSRTNDPYSIINGITIYNKWEDLSYTLVVPPPNLNVQECRDLLDGKAYQDEGGNLVYDSPTDGFGQMGEDDLYFICQDESELLELFLDIIEDSDVISGWNSEWYDIPYLIQRIRITLGGESIEQVSKEDGSEANPYNPSESSQEWIQRLCLFPCLPQLRHMNHYGAMEKTYKLFGRVHLDYLDLYQKFTFEELHSYSLDFVLKKEIKQSKIPYEGSLDQLYRNDFRRFTAYNRQDTNGLAALDKKLKMVELANTMSHMAGVTLDKALGSVVIIEQAILKRLHRMGYIGFDKQQLEKDLPVPGAYVVDPEKGKYDWVCSYDFNSLYPTVIRLINISPETIVGQFRLDKTKREWWRMLLKISKQDSPDGDKNQEYVELLVNNQEYRDDFIHSIGEKQFNGHASSVWKQFEGVLEYHDVIDQTDEKLTLVIEGTGEEIILPAREWKEELLKNNWSISGNGTVFDLNREGIVTTCMTEWYNERVEFKKKKNEAENKAELVNDPDTRKQLLLDAEYYDSVQTVKKIFLNSTYGAYLNRFFLFYDPRLGASVTLSGRLMTKNMITTLEALLDEAPQ